MTEPLASPWFVPAMAVVCYLGLVLYGGVVSVSGRYADASGWPLLIYYGAFFPTPIGSGLWVVQSVVVLVTGVLVGPDILYRFVWRKREYTLPPSEAPVPWGQRVLIGLPALVVFLWAGWIGINDVLPLRGDLVALNAAVGRVWAVVMVMVGGYFAIAFYLGAQIFRDLERMPLLRTSARFHRMNGIGALLAPALGLVFYLWGPYGTAGQLGLLSLLLIALAPGLNEIAWSYDAVLTRILTGHVVLAAAAAIFVFVPGWIEALGGTVLYRWAATLVVLAVVAMALPPWVESRLRGWLFPAAEASRARLAGLLSEPFTDMDRRRVAEELLGRTVDALDAEGGAVVLPADGAEAAIVASIGDVRIHPIGNEAEAVRWVARVAPGPEPRWYQTLDGNDRVKMLLGGFVLACPLGAGEKGAILVGPRRGWLYDRSTVRALQTLGRQARFAFDNLALARARAHGEKLAALGEAAARIAHEIRNPLAAARSLVQLAGADVASREVTEPALDEIDRIGRLVGDLLAFARREETIETSDVDLADACRQAVAQLTPQCEAAAVRVRTHLTSVSVRADLDRVVQLLANLGRNALEAIDEGTGSHLDFACGVKDDTAWVEVRDDGPGIPPERRATIFEPFHTSKPKGTGLGLAIGRRIARAHGGDLVLLDSDPGRGSRFRLTLPLEPRGDRAGTPTS